MKGRNLVNTLGQPVQLGAEIGKGGEGSVYEVTGRPSLVAKIYHQMPLDRDAVAKLETMVECGTPELESISAWPHSLLYVPERRQPCGILLPRIADARHLHELYGTFNRRRHFPEAKWKHLLLAAYNVAAAFDTLHSAGIVVGDVNQGNLMVDAQMRVRFIDCDSFQIHKNGRVFPCPVGTPHFTPPELQSTKLRDVRRTPNHDHFGMAILIFHLLFVGRHPFAGRYRGWKDMSIERAIAERRFAFSRNRNATQVDPPPASLLLDDLPEPLSELFESAFRATSEDAQRPTAKQWCEQLKTTLKRGRICGFDASHIYFDRLSQCPWCRIEDDGGPAFFVTGGSASLISHDRLEVFDRKIRELELPSFPDLAPRQLAIPTALPLTPLREMPRQTRADAAAIALAVGVVLCLLSVTSGWLLVAGVASALVGGAYLLFGNEAKARRAEAVTLLQQLASIQSKLLASAASITDSYRKRKANFESALEELTVECDYYRADKTNLENVLVYQRGAQKNQFLAQQLIQDNLRSIPGLTNSMVSMLQSFGVESAYHVDKLNLSVIPNMSAGLKIELLRWREQVESTFTHKPEHGVSFADAKTANEAAVRRFKAAQARRVLMGAKRLGGLVDEGRYELQRELVGFEQLTSRAREAAIKLRDFQSRRRPLERWLNRSLAVILGCAIAAPVVGLLLWLLFG